MADNEPALDWAMVVRLTWRSVLAACGQMMPLFLVVALLNALIGAGERWSLDAVGAYTEAIHAGYGLRVLAVSVVVLVGLVAWAVVLAPVAVAVHRLVLLEEVTPGLGAFFSPRIRRFAVWTFWLQVLIAVAWLPVEVSGYFLVRVAAAWGALFLLARTLLVFPMVAIDVPADFGMERVDKSWEMTRGRFWMIFGGLIVSIAPVIVIEYVPGLVASMLWSTAFIAEGVNAKASPLEELLVQIGPVIGDFTEPFKIALAAAVASWVYRWVVEHPVPVPQTSPEV
jgi:hypothetical protein